MQSAIQNSRNDTNSQPCTVRLKPKTLEHMPFGLRKPPVTILKGFYLFITATKQEGSEVVMAILGEGTIIERM